MVHRKSWPPPPPRPAKPKRKRKRRRGNNGNWHWNNSFSRCLCVYKGGVCLFFFSKFCGRVCVSLVTQQKVLKKRGLRSFGRFGRVSCNFCWIWIFFPQQCGSFAFGWVEAFLAEKVIHSGKGAKGWFFQMFLVVSPWNWGEGQERKAKTRRSF